MNLKLDRYNIGNQVFLDQSDKAQYFEATNKSKDQFIMKLYSPRNAEENSVANNDIIMSSHALVSKGIVKQLSQCINQIDDEITKQKQTKIYILMEYVSNNLRGIIQERQINNQYFTKEELERHLRQLLKTLTELQVANISHGRVEVERIFQVKPDGDLLLGDFSDAQNLFGLEQSEIVSLNFNKIRTLKFPDQESLVALLQGESQINTNYYKNDIYSLGIVACQMATLNLYQDHIHFKKEKQSAFDFIQNKYGQAISELVKQLLAPRATRKDFILISQDLDSIFSQSLPQQGPQNQQETSRIHLMQQSERKIEVSISQIDVPITDSKIVEVNHVLVSNQSINTNPIQVQPEIRQQPYSAINPQPLSITEFILLAKTFDKLKWVELKQIKLGDFIGEGSRSKVYNCDVAPNRNFCVAKKYYANDNNQLLDILISLNQLNSLDIKQTINVEFFNISQVIGDNSKSELIVIQKKKVFNLKTLLDNYILGLRTQLNIAQQIVRILIELHAKGVIHGALQPKNILLDQNKIVFLTDFGYSEIQKEGNESWMCTSRFSKPVYSSPEQYNDGQICMQSDVWSLGIILQEFICQTKISQDLIQEFGLYDPLREGSLNLYNPGSRGFFSPFSNLISQMTQFKPERRIKLVDIETTLTKLQDSIKQDRFNQRKENNYQCPPAEHLHKHSSKEEKCKIEQQQNQSEKKVERPVSKLKFRTN